MDMNKNKNVTTQFSVVLYKKECVNTKNIHFIGSGKRALFEVISRRAQGPTRGQILLNGVPMSMRLFQVSNRL